MVLKSHFTLLFFFLIYASFAQKNKSDFAIGFSSGYGHELKNKDYEFNNKYYKIHIGYVIKNPKLYTLELIIEPEINFANQTLINPFLIPVDDPDYLMKWEYYSKTNKINQYILNLGNLIR